MVAQKEVEMMFHMNESLKGKMTEEQCNLKPGMQADE